VIEEVPVVARLLRRVRALWRRSTLDAQLDSELQFHLDLEAAENARRGLSPGDARTTALRSFGGVERVREECRDARRVSWADTLSRNTRYAIRVLCRQPGYTIAVVCTLGLGIGANTAIFSVINGVLLKPLPYASGDRLVLIGQSAPLAGQDDVPVSIAELQDYRRQLADFEGLVEYHQMSFDLIKRGEPDRVDTGVVSANFFHVLGLTPILGRDFRASDEQHGADAVLLLSYTYWKTRFGGDPSIVGQVFELNDRPHTVIGVLPAVPLYPQECDVYMPTSACPFRARSEQRIAENRRIFGNLRVFGRLKPGVTPEHASTQVATVGSRFRQQYPDAYKDARGFRATTSGVLAELTRNARPMLLVLLGATGLVLLLASANVASLTLARTLNRDRELALRTALGAGRGQLFEQLLTESLLLASAGGAIGLVVAWGTLGALSTFVARFTTRVGDIGIDQHVLWFTAAVSLATGLAFGALPAAVGTPAPAGALRQMGAGSSTPRRRRLQQSLVVAQVAVSVVLLVSAGLLLASFSRLQRVDAGYRTERVLSAEVFGNFTRYATPDACLRLYSPLLERLQQLPGVQTAAISTVVPLSSNGVPFLNPFLIEGRAAEGRVRPTADVNIASSDYFRALGISVIAGRTFQQADTRTSAPVVVISQRMARYWDSDDPVGSRVSFDKGEHWVTVVGVVGDVRQYGLERDSEAQAYLPLEQAPVPFGAAAMIRTSGDPMLMARAIRDAVHTIDPDLPVENIQTLEDLRRGFLAKPRLTAILLTIFAGIALVVTLAGLTGVVATSVSQRTQEFGVRLALGATPSSVLVQVVGQGALLVVLGLGVGIAVAAATGRLLTAYLYATEPTDPITLIAVGAAILVAGIAACLGPARRATRIDPILALRSE
jgi:putative ABC transport system permease protein